MTTLLSSSNKAIAKLDFLFHALDLFSLFIHLTSVSLRYRRERLHLNTPHLPIIEGLLSLVGSSEISHVQPLISIQ